MSTIVHMCQFWVTMILKFSNITMTKMFLVSLLKKQSGYRTGPQIVLTYQPIIIIICVVVFIWISGYSKATGSWAWELFLGRHLQGRVIEIARQYIESNNIIFHVHFVITNIRLEGQWFSLQTQQMAKLNTMINRIPWLDTNLETRECNVRRVW